KGCRWAHRIVCPAVQVEPDVFSHEGPILFEADFGVDLHGMSSSTRQKLLFPGKGKLDGPSGLFCHEGRAELPGPQLHFPAETSSDKGFNHTDVVFSHLESRRQEALDNVGHLSRGPESDPSIQVALGQG